MITVEGVKGTVCDRYADGGADGRDGPFKVQEASKGTPIEEWSSWMRVEDKGVGR